MTFHPKELWVISSSLDLMIKVWSLHTSECIVNFEGHFSAVTSFVVDSINTDIIVR